MSIIVKIFLDLEATQFSKEIISIGAISEKNNEFYSLVRSKNKVSKLITNLTGITNSDLKSADKFYKVFDSFWTWCCSQRTYKKEKILFIVYGNFDKELIYMEYKRREKDNRLLYILKNIVDYQYYLMMSLYGTIGYSLSLLNATKFFTKDDSYEQDHNSLNDAKLLKIVYDNVGEPNIENIIHAEKENITRKIKKSFGKKSIKDKDLEAYLSTKESLLNLKFDDIKKYVDTNSMIKEINYDYWILSGRDCQIEISLDEKEGL